MDAVGQLQSASSSLLATSNQKTSQKWSINHKQWWVTGLLTTSGCNSGGHTIAFSLIKSSGCASGGASSSGNSVVG